MDCCSTVVFVYSSYRRPGLEYQLLPYCSLQLWYKTRDGIWTAVLLLSTALIEDQGWNIDYCHTVLYSSDTWLGIGYGLLFYSQGSNKVKQSGLEYGLLFCNTCTATILYKTRDETWSTVLLYILLQLLHKTRDTLQLDCFYTRLDYCSFTLLLCTV